MDLGARPAGRPAPSRAALAVSWGVVVTAPLAALYVLLWGVWNVRPTVGSAFVDLPAVHLGESNDLGAIGDANVTADDGVTLELWDDRVLQTYYLPADLAVGAVLLGVLLVMLAAVLVLLRRPASRVLAGALLVYAALAGAAAWAGPVARQAGVDRAIELNGVPTTAAQAREAGTDFYVLPDVGDWTPEWHGAFLALALASLGAATYVLHVRHSRTFVDLRPQSAPDSGRKSTKVRE